MIALLIIPIIFWVLFWIFAAFHFSYEKNNTKAAIVCLLIAGPHGWLLLTGFAAFYLVAKVFK